MYEIPYAERKSLEARAGTGYENGTIFYNGQTKNQKTKLKLHCKKVLDLIDNSNNVYWTEPQGKLKRDINNNYSQLKKDGKARTPRDCVQELHNYLVKYPERGVPEAAVNRFNRAIESEYNNEVSRDLRLTFVRDDIAYVPKKHQATYRSFNDLFNQG